jgi:hypothetical protein
MRGREVAIDWREWFRPIWEAVMRHHHIIRPCLAALVTLIGGDVRGNTIAAPRPHNRSCRETACPCRKNALALPQSIGMFTACRVHATLCPISYWTAVRDGDMAHDELGVKGQVVLI